MAEEPKKHKVLIVDDETINIELLGNLLRDEINVIFATSGEEALTIAKSSKPDLVLLDIGMPGMDGYQVCRALKSDPETEKVPVIFITAKDTEHEEAYGLELGAVDYITKPFNPQIVKSKVKNHLAKLPGPGATSPVAGDQPLSTKPSSGKRFAWVGGLAVGVIALAIAGVLFSGKFTGPPAEIVAVKRVEAPSRPAAPMKPDKKKPVEAKTKSVGKETVATLPPPQEDEGDTRAMAEVLGYGWVLKTKCGPIPDVEWWKFRTHEDIAGYVTRKHKGDWKAYIEVWTIRLVKLQDIYLRGSSAVVTTGQVLKGPLLQDYVKQMRDRLSVIRCLGAEAAADKARKSAAVSHDLLKRGWKPDITERGELIAARVSAGLAVVVAGFLGIRNFGFVAEVVAFAFGLAAASFFPAIIMGIFSKRMNREGAILGMIAGITFTASYIVYFKFINPGANTLENWWFGISPEGIGTVGMLLNFAVAVTVSRFTPAPPPEIARLVDSIRVPKGAGEAHEISG